MKQNFKNAKLRVCASCEWIFKDYAECPKCSFAYYTAHYVYGKKAYQYAITQQPWIDKQLSSFLSELYSQVAGTNQFKKKERVGLRFTFLPEDYQ
jgi:hypothetical protein